MIEPEPGEEPGALPIEDNKYLAGGIELHARIVEVAGKPGVDFTFEPAIHDREIPLEIEEYNQAIEDNVQRWLRISPTPESRTILPGGKE
jgi:hypothetical protein